jgi:tRNA 2-thiouridine synthesizing protein A
MVTLDLRGEVCPYTFVKTKLALEELARGAELRVLIDHAPAAQSVPRACREAGHDVLAIERLAPNPDGEEIWEIRVRKGRKTG